MPRKHNRSRSEKVQSNVDAKSKKVKKPRVSKLRVKRSRLKRQLAFDEGTKPGQHKDGTIGDGSDKTEVAKNQVVEVMDESKNPTPSQFKFERILSENPTSKSVALFGRFPADCEDNFAVILAEKMAFTHETVGKLFTEKTTFTHNLQNDIYGQYVCNADVKLTVIHPATEKHVKKYTRQNSVMIQESGNAYAAKVKPYAETQALSLQVLSQCTGVNM